MVVADTRSPCKLEQEPDTVDTAFVELVKSTRPATSDQLKRIREASAKDAQLQKVMEFTLVGWPAHLANVPLQIREFFRGHLSVSNGLLTYDDRVVVPADMREEILERIHTGHQGITKCHDCANLSVW